jgi:hypothetical protein
VRWADAAAGQRSALRVEALLRLDLLVLLGQAKRTEKMVVFQNDTSSILFSPI